MILLATVIVVAFALFLIGFTGVIFLNPAMAQRFLMLFARSARAHFVEQFIRLMVGASLVVLSSSLWQPDVFRILGWAVVISSAALICTPWRWHHRLAKRMVPLIIRHLRLCAMGPLAFGALLLYAVLSGGT